MKKKFFAILVAGAVFFSMLPMVAFGDTGNGSEPPNGTPQTEMGTPNSTDPDNLIDSEEPDGEEDVYADSLHRHHFTCSFHASDSSRSK